MSAVLAAPLESTSSAVDFQTHPSRYKHWRLNVAGDTARLVLDIAEDGGIRPGYKLKLNSYDLGVDIELHDALNRIRFEHPAVKLVILDSAKERIWCSGANIYMLGLSSHAWKVNFCKFTNETRNGMEDSSRHDGLKFLAAVTGACAGGGYELALACDRILMVDDRSSTVSLPEVPLLGVLPGTGGLTRLMDKRRVRRDLADIFCLTSEGVRADRAKQWKLIDELAKPQQFVALTEQVGKALKAQSTRNGPDVGIKLPALEVQHFTKDKYAVVSYPNVLVTIDTEARHATITVKAPQQAVADTPQAIEAAGANWWPLAFARELDDAILQLRTNWLEVGTWIFKTEGSAEQVLQADAVLQAHANYWLVRETRGMLRRTFARLDVSSRSMIALIEPGSCFVGSLLELALAADRSYMLDTPESAALIVNSTNLGNYPTVAGVTRLASRYNGDSAAILAVQAQLDQALAPAQALALGLVTATPDEIDWDDEIRLMLEERASLSPDALTGLEASLRFNGAETMETRIFARLSAWQNWIFNRPNAVGEAGALKLFGTGKKAKFDWKRV